MVEKYVLYIIMKNICLNFQQLIKEYYDAKELKEFFWNMFIADTLVGNFDRHNGNWGFLINEKLKNIEIAQIYDCGSCLYPQLTDERISEIINDEF